MYVSLYRRYRPQKFNEVVGQNAAVEVVQKALIRKNIGHAYLFSGPRGCGKTTLARLLAKAVNCSSPMENGEACDACENCLSILSGKSLDVVEIDGASNNRVDEIRDLKTHVSLAPFSCPYKVYIIDEVHMLSIGAFNALLKTLEEPPAYVLFILATTEPHKVPVTIRSRCQHIPFHRICMTDIVSRLVLVADKEGITYEDEALWEIARQADGALRDALSLMEQAIAVGGDHLTMETMKKLLGGGSRFELESWIRILREAPHSAFEKLEDIFLRGASPERVVNELYVIFRNMWITSRWEQRGLSAIEISAQERDFLKDEVHKWKSSVLLRAMELCAKLVPHIRMGLRSDVISGLIFTRLSGLLTVSEETVHIHPESTPPLPSCSVVQQEGEDTVEDSQDRTVSCPSEKPDKVESLPVPEGVEKSWNRLMDELYEENPHLVCALLDARVSLNNKELTIELPSAHRYAFELLAMERNAYNLQGKLLRTLNFEASLRFCCGESSVNISALDSVVSSSDKNSSSKDESEVAGIPSIEELKKRVDIDDIKNPQREQPDSNKAKEEAVPAGIEECVHKVMKYTSGELLYLRREENGEGEDGTDDE